MRRWIVLTAARAPHAVGEIIGYTEWDGYPAGADEVVYTAPVDAMGNPVDALWKVGGTVVLLNGVYTYAEPGTEPSFEYRMRSQVHAGYLFWRRFGRTGHWAGLRAHLIPTPFDPLDSADKWAYNTAAVCDHGINGTFPVTGPMTPAQVVGLVDHADFIYRNLGEEWYDAQIQKVDDPPMNPIHGPTENARSYRQMSLLPGAPIYIDIVTLLGVNRPIDGVWEPMGVNFRDGFDPELRSLGN